MSNEISLKFIFSTLRPPSPPPHQKEKRKIHWGKLSRVRKGVEVEYSFLEPSSVVWEDTLGRSCAVTQQAESCGFELPG